MMGSPQQHQPEHRHGCIYCQSLISTFDICQEGVGALPNNRNDKMAASPTNHTSSAFFGIMGLDSKESSMDEQSSIDCSQLMESSTHTSSLLGAGHSAAGASNFPDRRDGNASVLESVLEERSTRTEESSTFPPLNPLPNKLQEHVGADQSVANPSTTRHSTAETSTTNHRLGSAPSKTLHTSNVDIETYKQFEEESDKFAAWAIHVALVLFCGLIIISVLSTFFVIQKYGLVAMMGLSFVLMFAIFMACFVDSTILSKDTRLKPIRSKIMRVVQVAKQAVVEEFHLFQSDWNTHLLLTNGRATDDEENGRGAALRQSSQTHCPEPTHNKKRSVVFRLIKPVFRLRKKWFRGKGKHKKAKDKSGSSNAYQGSINAYQGSSNVYQPPPSGSGVVA